MPMIRYRTRDITSIVSEPCTCGRSLRRIRRISHRRRHVHHPRRERVSLANRNGALAVEGTLPHYQIVLTRQKDLDQIEVRVEVTPEG